MTQVSQEQTSVPPPVAPAPAAPTVVTLRDRSNPIDQPSVSAVLRLRTKWIVLGAVLGAIAGLVFSLIFEAGRYTASTVLEVAPTATESQRAAQLAQAVNVFAGSSPVYNQAAEANDVTAADLRRRTKVVWEDGTSIITISVSARSSQAAQDQATSLADTVINLSESSTGGQRERLLRESQEVLARDVLTDPTAEQARKGSLGSAVADQQGGVIASGTQITVINPADTAEPSGLTAPLGSVLGAFAGLVLMAAAAVLLPVARHRIRNNREIATLAPSLQLRSRRAAHEQAGRLMESGARAMVILAMPGAEESARQLASRIVRVVAAHSLSAQFVDASDGLTSGQASALRRGEIVDGDTILRVVAAPANEDTIELLAGQTDVLSSVVSVPNRTRLEDLQDVTSAVATTRPVAIVWS